MSEVSLESKINPLPSSHCLAQSKTSAKAREPGRLQLTYKCCYSILQPLSWAEVQNPEFNRSTGEERRKTPRIFIAAHLNSHEA